MKEIPLTKGKVAIVSDEDYEELSKYNWHAKVGNKTFYAMRSIKTGVNKQKNIFMHRVIMQTPKDMVTDHIDGNGLNNQRENLRLCTHSENLRNRKKNTNNTSGYKGVCWNKVYKKWQAQLCFNSKVMNLGCFLEKEDAYKAYCEASEKYHKDYKNN